MKILIAYATTTGHTRGIAREVADWLVDAGHVTELLAVADAQDIALDRFDAVVLAGSIHVGGYQKALTEFCAARAGDLARRPSLFLSVSLSAAGHDADDWKGLDRILSEFTGATGWTPGRVVQVAGAYLQSRYDVFSRFMMRRILAKKDPDANPDTDKDYTDRVALAATVAEWVGGLGAAGGGISPADAGGRTGPEIDR